MKGNFPFDFQQARWLHPTMEKTSLQKRVKERIDALGLNPVEAARRAGLGTSFVRDILRGKTRSPSAENLQKVATALQTTPEYLSGRAVSTESTVRPVAAKVEGIPVIGKVSATAWYTVDDLAHNQDDEDIERVPSVSGFPVEWQYGMIVEGNCLNKLAQDGDRLVCLDLVSSHTAIRDGDLVIIERARFDGQMVQRTAKRVRAAEHGWELWPESTDPAHQEPIRVDSAVEGETIRVMAKVLWILRRP